MFLKNEVSTIIFNDEDLRDYVVSIISESSGLERDFVSDNLVLDNNRINSNSEIKFSEVDSIYHNDYMYFNIEINTHKSNNTDSKNFRYVCHLILKQVPIGEKDKYRKIYQININDYDYFGKDRFIYQSSMMEENLYLKRNDFMTIIDINLAYLRNIDYNQIKRERANSLKKLLYIFICNDKNKREELYNGDNLMEKVNKKLEFLIDEFGNLYYDKEAYMDAVYYELGTKDGIEIGAKNKSIEIARNLIQMNLKIDDIIKITSLTKEEVVKLKEEIS